MSELAQKYVVAARFARRVAPAVYDGLTQVREAEYAPTGGRVVVEMTCSPDGQITLMPNTFTAADADQHADVIVFYDGDRIIGACLLRRPPAVGESVAIAG